MKNIDLKNYLKDSGLDKEIEDNLILYTYFGEEYRYDGEFNYRHPGEIIYEVKYPGILTFFDIEISKYMDTRFMPLPFYEPGTHKKGDVIKQRNISLDDVLVNDAKDYKEGSDGGTQNKLYRVIANQYQITDEVIKDFYEVKKIDAEIDELRKDIEENQKRIDELEANKSIIINKTENKRTTIK